MGVFADWQPEYAARGIATFPVEIVGKNKKPALTNYEKVGLRGSEQLARKPRFAVCDAFGFMAGRRSGKTVLDVDTTDERVLVDALKLHGDTPLIARTASGKYHAYYRFNGEDRLKLERVRPWGDDVPIDLLHSLLVVATPSKAPGGQYEFIRGRIHQLDDLPVMRGLEGLAKVLKGPPARISTSMRVTVSPGAKCATATAATAP